MSVNITASENIVTITDGDTVEVKVSETTTTIIEVSSSIITVSDDFAAHRFRVANSAPSSPLEAEVYYDTVEHSLYCASD